MQTKLKAYSLTLDPFYAEEARLEQGNLSKVVNNLLREHIEKKSGSVKKKGNLSLIATKLKRRNLKHTGNKIDIKKEMSEYYASKFGR